MIEILKKGILPTAPFYKGKCSYCGCEVKASVDDHKEKSFGISHRTRTICVDCPTEFCGHDIICKKERRVCD